MGDNYEAYPFGLTVEERLSIQEEMTTWLRQLATVQPPPAAPHPPPAASPPASPTASSSPPAASSSPTPPALRMLADYASSAPSSGAVSSQGGAAAASAPPSPPSPRSRRSDDDESGAAPRTVEEYLDLGRELADTIAFWSRGAYHCRRCPNPRPLFTTRSLLARHALRHTGFTARCKLCGYSHSRPDEVSQHVRRRHPEAANTGDAAKAHIEIAPAEPDT